MRAARAAVVVVVLLAPGCGDHGGAANEAPPAAVTAQPVVAARRPSRRYYLGRTTSRCEVYSVDGDEFSRPTRTPCPIELLAGERIRIAGRTCMRESTDQAREVPVVCPDPLTNAEKHDREKPAETAATGESPP